MEYFEDEIGDHITPIILIPEQLTVAITPEIQSLVSKFATKLSMAMDESNLKDARRIIVISILSESIKYEMLRLEAMNSLLVKPQDHNPRYDLDLPETII